MLCVTGGTEASPSYAGRRARARRIGGVQRPIMGSGGTDDVGAGWNPARGADEVALLSEEITAARVTALRHTVAAAARSAGLLGHGLEDFVLAVHELVTRVVRHGGGAARCGCGSTTTC